MSNLKQKPAIAKMLFGRSLIIAVLLLVQIGILFLCFLKFLNFTEYIVGGFSLISAIMIVYIINKNQNPAFKLTWILTVLVTPVLGVFFYLFVNTNLGTKKFRKRVLEIIEETKGYLKIDENLKKEITNKGFVNISNYVENTSGYPIYTNTSVKYFPLGEDKFEKIKEELKKAEDFIFLEYFIIEEGIMWNSILEILGEKVKDGVEVRVMYDGMGTMLTLPKGYEKTLRKKGIKAKVFSPVVPLLSTHQNNRDHRKILVIDGKVAFNGGINLADEYINKKDVFGHWKDVAVMIEGEAVKSFTHMFLQLWNVGEVQVDNYFRYFKGIEQSQEKGYVMPYGDDPLMEDRIGESVYMDIIYKAKKYVHIMTPYLIIDNEMVTALTVAAKSGIDVKILVPHIPDKQITFDIARSFYPVLIDAGVEIYEYTPGFVHGKMFVSDDIRAVVGTINLDYRSLYHHFECATYMEEVEAVWDIEKDFMSTIGVSQKITISDFKNISVIRRISGRVFRLFAPLL